MSSSMHFPLIESAIATCERHMDGLPEDDPHVIEIENHLVSSLVVLLASELENSASHAAWDNIMRARHAVVHKQGSMNLTLREFRDAYPKIQDVTGRLLDVLGLEDTQWTSA